MDYQAALDFIKESSRHGWKLDLTRISEILKRLDRPDREFRSIHIAGTNGKGSTAAMFDFILQEASFKTGRYNSPHLTSYRERFLINGKMISKEQLANIVSELKPVIRSIIDDGWGAPTEFEIGTAIAFLYFARQHVDVAMIEVGMGGRWDATNIIQPILSVITHLAFDHQQYLGDTLEAIAFEKAGIIKNGVPVVIGVQTPEIEQYLCQIVVSRKATANFASDLKIKNYQINELGATCEITNAYFGEIKFRLNLIGKHQIFNGLNVLSAVGVLEKSGIKISKENFQIGLTKTEWPGRMELIPQTAPVKFYLDGAHNPDGARALVETVKSIYPGQKVDLLVGILNNRPLREMAEILAEVARKVIITEVPDPKTSTVRELSNIFKELGLVVIEEPVPEKALDLLLKTGNRIAVASGSLYLIGWLRSLLFKNGD